MFQIALFFQLNTIAFASIENTSNTYHTVNILAFHFAPFTYFDSDRRFVDGIDVQLLKTIAKRLNLNLIWTKANQFDQISVENIKYVQNTV